MIKFNGVEVTSKYGYATPMLDWPWLAKPGDRLETKDFYRTFETPTMIIVNSKFVGGYRELPLPRAYYREEGNGPD